MTQSCVKYKLSQSRIYWRWSWHKQQSLMSNFRKLKKHSYTIGQKKRTLEYADIAEYHALEHDLYFSVDLMFYKHRVCIPDSMKQRYLNSLHIGHVAQATMHKRAENTVFWPHISRDIRNFADGCCLCQITKPAQQKEPLIPHTIPQFPGQIVVSDFMKYGGFSYVLFLDAFSLYCEIFPVRTENSSDLRTAWWLQYISRNGIPMLFRSDNGPAYSALGFGKLLESLGTHFSPAVDPIYPNQEQRISWGRRQEI